MLFDTVMFYESEFEVGYLGLFGTFMHISVSQSVLPFLLSITLPLPTRTLHAYQALSKHLNTRVLCNRIHFSVSLPVGAITHMK